jgi:hypothetical protein
MTISEPIRVHPSDNIQYGAVFEPTTATGVWRFTDCDEDPLSNVFEFQGAWQNYFKFVPGLVGAELDTSTSLWSYPYRLIPANSLTGSGLVGFECISIQGGRVFGTDRVWELRAEFQLVAAYGGRGHTEVTKTVRSRTAQAWRANPWAESSPLPEMFGGLADPADPDSFEPISISCTEVGGQRVDVNGQPMQINIDQHVMTVSFVIRAPYYDVDTAGVGSIVVPEEWEYWTTGEGASMIGNRNGSLFFGWPSYSLVMESLNITKIGKTTFHRVDLVFVHDEWWHLEQAPATVVGSMPPIIPACVEGGETILFQTNVTLWVNPYLRYSDFNDFMDYVPYDSRSYIEDAITLTGSVPS